MTPPSPAAAVCERPWAAVWSMLVGFFMLMLDSTIVSVANPSIQAGLGASLTETIWVTSAYLLGLAVPLLVAGRLGDRFGQKQVFMVGMAVFALASLAGGLAPNVTALIAARAVQGVGGSLMSPQTQAVIVRIFPPERRGAAMGLWGSVSGIAMLVGPILGGVLVRQAGWQAIFWINVPVGVVGLILAARHIPKLSTSRPKFDWLGMVLSGLGVLLVVFGLQEAVGRDWGRVWGPVTIGRLIAAGVVLLVVFVIYQARTSAPLIPLRLFRDRDFALSNGTIFLIGVGIAGLTLPILYFIQVARGLSPIMSALFLMPTAVVGGLLAPLVGGKFVARFGARRVACFGLAVMAASVAWDVVYFTSTSNVWLAMLPGVTIGVGNACMWSPVSLSATRHLAPQDAGAGAGVYNTVRQVGSALGAAAMNTLMNARLAARGVDPGLAGKPTGALTPAQSAAFSHAMGDSMWLTATVFATAAVIAAFLTGKAGRAR
ncbi:MAG: DHA2 family efflux MFS transporter permease subunit [Propionibacteriaceae bacterium]|nr:DHA2 family efflux MFS transporter permease subunit [Propionibacteriaceae bacterium]